MLETVLTSDSLCPSIPYCQNSREQGTHGSLYSECAPVKAMNITQVKTPIFNCFSMSLFIRYLLILKGLEAIIADFEG